MFLRSLPTLIRNIAHLRAASHISPVVRPKQVQKNPDCRKAAFSQFPPFRHGFGLHGLGTTK